MKHKGSEIIQTWIHIDDTKYSDKSQTIRFVFDVYTLNDFFCYNFEDLKISNINVISRNTNYHLPYIMRENIMRISFGPMNKWPKVPKTHCGIDRNEEFSDWYHVKFEVKFNVLNLNFEKNFLGLSYDSHLFVSKDNIQPEFHLKLSRGLIIDKNSLNATVIFNYDNKSYFKEFKYVGNEIIIEHNHQVNKYSIILDADPFIHILKNNLNSLTLSYSVKYDKIYFIVPILAFMSLILSILGLILSSGIELPLATLIAIIVLYFTLVHEGFEFPLKKYSFYSILTSVFLVFAMAFKTFLF
ncbi:MAG: hypothetical protein LBM96_00480 [Methanobrevibacter sp.]|jgi:hypothetical protein|nr:hypothetical protein [Candidatus Methanoflexus mossambicus]